jgi:hypothetical protein
MPFLPLVLTSYENGLFGQNRFCLEAKGGREKQGRGQGKEIAQMMYAHMNK